MSAIDRTYLMGTYPDPPITFVGGKGSYLSDAAGKQYLDFVGGLAVTSLGHAHPVVASAISSQASTLLHVSNLYGNEIGPKVAATLDRLIGGGESQARGQVFFCNSGAEANECGLKLARKWAGPSRHLVISAWDSFHGRTMATLAATGQPKKHEAFAPMPPGYGYVAYNDLDALQEALDESGGEVAAVILESIQGEGGVNVPSSDYLVGVRALCCDHNALLIMDEVQTGLGRTGKWFGFQHSPLSPDIVTMAKALGNGVPVGACWAKSEVAAAFVPGDHASTFGGQPLAMAAVEATLSVMEQEYVCAKAQQKGALLQVGLSKLDHVDHIRGKGLLLACGLSPGISATLVATLALKGGLVVNALGDNAIRFAPSLLVSDAEIDEAIGILNDVLSSLVPMTKEP